MKSSSLMTLFLIVLLQLLHVFLRMPHMPPEDALSKDAMLEEGFDEPLTMNPQTDMDSSSIFFLESIHRYKESSNQFAKPFVVLPEYLVGKSLASVASSGALLDRFGAPLQTYAVRHHANMQTLQRPDATSHLVQPNITDKATVLTLAKISYDAYYRPNDTQHKFPVDPFVEESDYGWDNDGLRGYVYRNKDCSVYIMAIKGTSTALFSRNSTTVGDDKRNDNLMFSCCCARVDFTWRNLPCSCYKNEGYTCSQSCLQASLREDVASYFWVAQSIANLLLTNIDASASVWFVGHSLGGALAALMGAKYFLDGRSAAVAFESPGERLYATRIGLVQPIDDPSRLPIYHFYNDADPIPVGKCTGPLSSCYLAGYAMESRCHLGNVAIYPTGAYAYDILYHRIEEVIKILAASPSVPSMYPHWNCTDCDWWTFTNDIFTPPPPLQPAPSGPAV